MLDSVDVRENNDEGNVEVYTCKVTAAISRL